MPFTESVPGEPLPHHFSITRSKQFPLTSSSLGEIQQASEKSDRLIGLIRSLTLLYVGSKQLRGGAIGSTRAFGAWNPGSSPGPGTTPLFITQRCIVLTLPLA